MSHYLFNWTVTTSISRPFNITVAHLSAESLNITAAENDDAFSHAWNSAAQATAVEIEELDEPFDKYGVNANNSIFDKGKDDDTTEDVDDVASVIAISEDDVENNEDQAYVIPTATTSNPSIRASA